MRKIYLAIPLHQDFDSVLAIDINAEMLSLDNLKKIAP
jgi:hypothetical protein